MSKIDPAQWTTILLGGKHLIRDWIQAFLLDRQTYTSPGTIYYYRFKLEDFARFCDSQGVSRLEDLSADLLRVYLLELERKGHNPGGRHAYYRAVKAFFRWWRLETERENDPYLFARVKAPKVPMVLQAPLHTEQIEALLKQCDNHSLYGLRNTAIILFLYDSGCRASEMLSIGLADLDPKTFDVKVWGKGSKERWVFVGVRTRRAIRSYLRKRSDDCPALWVNIHGERLKYQGLRQMLQDLARDAGIPKAAAHMLRRSHALSLANQHLDEFAIQDDMGHASIETTRRYIRRTRRELHDLRAKLSPVDNEL